MVDLKRHPTEYSGQEVLRLGDDLKRIAELVPEYAAELTAASRLLYMQQAVLTKARFALDVPDLPPLEEAERAARNAHMPWLGCSVDEVSGMLKSADYSHIDPELNKIMD